jgi:hypothetical protein
LARPKSSSKFLVYLCLHPFSTYNNIIIGVASSPNRRDERPSTVKHMAIFTHPSIQNWERRASVAHNLARPRKQHYSIAAQRIAHTVTLATASMDAYLQSCIIAACAPEVATDVSDFLSRKLICPAHREGGVTKDKSACHTLMIISSGCACMAS